jgi:hypothetical protein
MSHRNVIGSHSGPYTIYRALAVAAGQLDPNFKPNFYLTDSTTNIKEQVILNILISIFLGLMAQ